jgi:hypothetical protein
MMKIIKLIFRRFPLFIGTGIMASILLLGGCNGIQDTTTTKEVNIPFSIQVTPLHMDDTIAGQSYVFLVTVDYGTQEVKLIRQKAACQPIPAWLIFLLPPKIQLSRSDLPQ